MRTVGSPVSDSAVEIAGWTNDGAGLDVGECVRWPGNESPLDVEPLVGRDVGLLTPGTPDPQARLGLFEFEVRPGRELWLLEDGGAGQACDDVGLAFVVAFLAAPRQSAWGGPRAGGVGRRRPIPELSLVFVALESPSEPPTGPADGGDESR